VRVLCEVESLPSTVVGLYHRHRRSYIVSNGLEIVPRLHQLGDNRVPTVVERPAPDDAKRIQASLPVVLSPFL